MISICFFFFNANYAKKKVTISVDFHILNLSLHLHPLCIGVVASSLMCVDRRRACCEIFGITDWNGAVWGKICFTQRQPSMCKQWTMKVVCAWFLFCGLRNNFIGNYCSFWCVFCYDLFPLLWCLVNGKGVAEGSIL